MSAAASLTVDWGPPYLRSVRFIDESRGYAAGYRGLFSTSDGGFTWHRQTSELGVIARISTALHLRETGSIVWAGKDTLVVRTDDGLLVGNLISGKWHRQIVAPDLLRDLAVMQFSSSRVGWGAGISTVHRTTDGGATWLRVYRDPSGLIRSLFTTSESEVWAVSVDGIVLHTIDEGRTWKRYERFRHGLSDIQFLDPQHGWLCGSLGLIYRTLDGGVSWTPFGPRLADVVDRMRFGTENEGWAIGQREDRTGVIFHTCDGGSHWNSFDTNSKERLLDVEAVGSGEAWVVGRNGTLLHSSDHGRTWLSVRLPY
jgi:photosystem II stability/assembly factor-like uncharacterized protein